MKVYSFFICLFAIRLLPTSFAKWQTTLIESLGDQISYDLSDDSGEEFDSVTQIAVLTIQLRYIRTLWAYIMDNHKPQDYGSEDLVEEIQLDFHKSDLLLNKILDTSAGREKEKLNDLKKRIKTLITHFKQWVKSFKSDIYGVEEYATLEGAKYQRGIEIATSVFKSLNEADDSVIDEEEKTEKSLRRRRTSRGNKRRGKGRF